jgi:hypothetical protein
MATENETQMFGFALVDEGGVDNVYKNGPVACIRAIVDKDGNTIGYFQYALQQTADGATLYSKELTSEEGKKLIEELLKNIKLYQKSH